MSLVVRLLGVSVYLPEVRNETRENERERADSRPGRKRPRARSHVRSKQIFESATRGVHARARR